MKATKVGSTATVIRNSVLINPILPFGIVACTFFPDNLSRNSCINMQSTFPPRATFLVGGDFHVR